MNQQQVEQWIAQNGGSGRVQYSRSTQKVANPAKQMTLPDGSDNPNYDPTAPATIEINEEKWTAVDEQGRPTGAELHVRRRPDGDFDIVNQANANPTRPQASQATIGRVEGTPIPGTNPVQYDNTKPIWVERDANGQQVGPAKPLTAEQRNQWERDKNGGLTDEQIRQQNSPEARVGKPTGNTRQRTENGTTTKETEYLLPDGTREWRSQTETAANTPKPQQGPDGQWGYFDTTKTPPVWVPISGPQATPKPVQVNGQWGVWQPNKDNPSAPPTFVTIDVPKPGVTLKNVDEWTPDFSQPDLGIGKWAAAQRGKIGLSAEQGGITQDDYDNSVKDVLVRATTTISNVTSAQTVQHQRQQDEENIRNTRSNEAAADFGNAVNVLTSVAKGASPDALRQVVPGLMWEMNNARQQRASQASPLPALHPLFQIASAQSAATATPPAAKEQAPTTGPEPAPYQPPGQSAPVTPVFTPQPPVNLQPAANGAPVVPAPPIGAASPQSPAAPSATPAPTPAEIHGESRTAPSMIPSATDPNIGQSGDPSYQPSTTPIFSPMQGNVQAAATPPPANGGGILPGANPIPSDVPIDTTPPPQPATYGAGEDVSKIITPPHPLGPDTSGMFSGASNQMGTPQAGPLDALSQSMGGGGFDPIARAAELVRMGAPQEAVTQALVGSGLLDEPTRRRLGMVTA